MKQFVVEFRGKTRTVEARTPYAALNKVFKKPRYHWEKMNDGDRSFMGMATVDGEKYMLQDNG